MHAGSTSDHSRTIERFRSASTSGSKSCAQGYQVTGEHTSTATCANCIALERTLALHRQISCLVIYWAFILQVIIIGTDVPDITAEVLQHANTELVQNDISLGPSLDGGYYLIALRKSHDCLFTNIHWSTTTVYQETVRSAKAAELKFDEKSSLPRLRDIDFLAVRPDVVSFVLATLTLSAG